MDIFENPPFPNRFKKVKHWFKPTDKPTLAGRAMEFIYNSLVLRGEAHYADKIELLRRCREAKADFKEYIAEVNLKRTEEFSYSRRNARKAGFHHNNRKNPFSDHLFFFHHPLYDGLLSAKAYVTLLPWESERSHRHFVDLCQSLYDAGVHFVAKGSTPKGTLERIDDLIFYVHPWHKAKAAEVMESFLRKKQIAHGYIPGSTRSSVPGLSWSTEPLPKEGRLWQKITGSSIEWDSIGRNGIEAALRMPSFFEALAAAHRTRGHKKVADVFHKEAQRVARLIAQSEVTR